MLEASTPHQSRYRFPGLRCDGRGIATGERCVLLFPALERLFSFLAAYSAETSLASVVPALELTQWRSPLGVMAFTASVLEDSSHQIDRLAQLARVAQGRCYVGTARSYIRYRDHAAPFGYDVSEPLAQRDYASEGELTVFDIGSRQPLARQRRFTLSAMIARLRPRAVPHEDLGATLGYWAVSEAGLFRSVTEYLARNGLESHVGRFESDAPSQFRPQHASKLLFRVPKLPKRSRKLLASVPGIRLFAQTAERSAVELGFAHPLTLASCDAAFAAESLHLFLHDEAPWVLPQLPALVPVTSLIPAPHHEEPEVACTPQEAPEALALPIRVVRSPGITAGVRGARIPKASFRWFARALYVLPERLLSPLQLAVGHDALWLRSERPFDALPLSETYGSVSDSIYVARGNKLAPELNPSALSQRLRRSEDHCFFFPAEGPPTLVPKAAFGPVASAVSLLEHQIEEAEPLRLPQSEPLATFRYGSPRFPLKTP